MAEIDGKKGIASYAKRGDYLTSSIARWCHDSPHPEYVGDLATAAAVISISEYGKE